MNFLNQKKILLGMTGGIAAYKCAELVRRLKDHGADVRVVMTDGAKAFITPLTMQAVSGNPVAESLLDPSAEAAMGHIELAKWADLILIAPTTANFMASLAQGLAGDLLSTLCLATPSKIAVCPAMNQQMWSAPATQRNLATLIQDGRLIWGPAAGEQACGDIGHGRMLEPLQIVELVQMYFCPKPFLNKTLVITAGPTLEEIDPVRYISNHSSGKMGYAIAKLARYMGADVKLISGPTALNEPYQVELIPVKSAEDMLSAAISACDNADVFIACAAVADYKSKQAAANKIKKSAEEMTIELVRNPDVLASIAASAGRPFCVGFAAETQDVEKYALDKLERKKLDMIAANNVAIAGQGFSSNDNALTVFTAKGKKHELPLSDKEQLAHQLLNLIAQQL